MAYGTSTALHTPSTMLLMAEGKGGVLQFFSAFYVSWNITHVLDGVSWILTRNIGQENITPTKARPLAQPSLHTSTLSPVSTLFLPQLSQMARLHKSHSKKRAPGKRIPTPTTASKTHSSPIPDTPLRVDVMVVNGSDDIHDMMVLERLDAALDAISCPMNSDGEWEEVVPAAFEVVVQRKDKRELEEYEDLIDDEVKQ